MGSSTSSPSASWFRPALAELRSWPPRRWLAAALAGAVAGLLMGIPTDLVPTDLFRRMTPATWWDYPVWAVSALLLGLIAATYVRAPALRRERAGLAVGGGFIGYLAVGCPICNKLVVAALGVSGALSYFGPIQPALGVGSVVLLAATLAVRLRGLAACRVAPAPAAVEITGAGPASGSA